MFYSHQLLARKAPLGQIWMAATIHAKINRRKLDQLNIIEICEEILNPSVPMALRLCGILMGGVVIVYERKVKLLYDDVSRLLVEINEAWKVKAAPDPTVLPKGKTQAKREAVTLPENQETDVGDEQSLNFSHATAGMGFHHTAYVAMRLDNVDGPFNNLDDEDLTQRFHQADADNITLTEHFDFYQADTEMYNRFERFDIEGDDDTQMYFTPGDQTQFPATHMHSPPLRQEDPHRGDEVQGEPPEYQVSEQSDKCKQAKERQVPTRRKVRRPAASVMDCEQTIIPAHVYQSWLQHASDIISRRGRKRKAHTGSISTMKIHDLMVVPPVVLIDDLFKRGIGGNCYPAALLDLWLKSTEPQQQSASVRTHLVPPEQGHHHNPAENVFEDLHSGVGSQSHGAPIERQRTNLFNNDMLVEELIGSVRANHMNADFGATEVNLMVTPGSSGDGVRSIPSSESGHGIPSYNSEINSGRSNKKRPYSSSKNSNNGLEPVAEENPWQHPDPNFKLSRLPENGLTPDQELLVETGPTQTQYPILNHFDDKITDSIRVQMKAHFETPGSAQVESLNKLAAGMNRKAAAHLFYQTCVLASRDFLRVEQREPFGDIFISRGAKM